MDIEGVGSGLMRGAKMGATLEVLPVPDWVAFGTCVGLRMEVEGVRVLAFGRVQLLSRCSLMSSADTRSSLTFQMTHRSVEAFSSTTQNRDQD